MIFDKDLIYEIEEITSTKYNKYNYGNDNRFLIDEEEINSILEDLIGQYKKILIEKEEIIQDRDDNYRKILVSEQYE